ncbi:MAG: hypothetical protein JSW60_09370 [Thermoplasmatales archaeon]|nr:MAG: hypothetical protein JSW60_09370 [Thermoplasmatales archaeon]
MIIKNHEEFIGNLSVVQTQDSKHKLKFIAMEEIEIPEDAIPIENIRALIGKKIGILHIDSKYKLRKIPDKP